MTVLTLDLVGFLTAKTHKEKKSKEKYSIYPIG